jgi:hypothetical protein
MDPRTITIAGEPVQQQKLSTAVVKELILVRQKDAEKYPIMETTSWVLSYAFFGDDKHTDDVDAAIPYADLDEIYFNVLEYNKLRKGAAAGESAAAAETAS